MEASGCSPDFDRQQSVLAVSTDLPAENLHLTRGGMSSRESDSLPTHIILVSKTRHSIN